MLNWFFRLPLDCRFKYIYRGAVAFILLSVFVAVISVLVMLWPSKILDIINFEAYEAIGGNRTMKGYQIKAGDELEFEVRFKKYVDATATVTVLLKQVDDGYIYPYPDNKTTRMPLGTWHYKSSLIIPKSTPPGTYVIIRTYRYFVNNFRTVDISVTSNRFDIIPPGPDPIKLIMEGNEVSRQNQKALKKLEKR